MTTGTFVFQNKKGSRIISYVILAVTLGLTVLSRFLFGGALAVLLTFFGVLILLSTLGVFINQRLFIHTARYELSDDLLTLDADQDHIVLAADQVTGVSCEPEYDRKTLGEPTIRCWRLNILTQEKNYEFFSDTVIVGNAQNEASIERFQSFGAQLKRWNGANDDEEEERS